MEADNHHYIRYLEALKDSVIFEGLDTTALKEFLSSMSLEKWDHGTFRNSREVTGTVHFIVGGRLKVYQVNQHTGREHTIYILSRGDVFDILTLMDSHSHDVFWEALDDMELLQIDIDHIRTWVADNPKVQGRIMNYLGQRMRQLEGIATDISLNNTLVRLCHLLLKHVNDESHKLTLIDNLGNDELASLIGTTRAVVNRHIQELKHCGAITVGRKHIDIQNISRLLEIAEEKYFP